MKIGIDARFYGPIGKGLGRYTQKLIENLEKIDYQNQYIIFLRKENWDVYHPKNPNFKKILADYPWYSLTEQIFMPFVILGQKLNLIHFPHFNVPIFSSGKFIVTIHDLILTHFPTQKATTLSPLIYNIKRLGYKIVIWLAVKRAKKVITVSQYTKKELVKHFKISPAKVMVTYEASDRISQQPTTNNQQLLKKYNISKPYLLYVGNAYPHKNLEGLLLAFRKLIKDYKLDLQLVLVGKEDYFYRKLKTSASAPSSVASLLRRRTKSYGGSTEALGEGGQSSKLKTHVVFPGFIPDKELQTLYRNALLYVFPSFCEGFGLPPLEAQAQGLPVVSSNSSSLPEILGDSVLYFDPHSIDNMAKVIAKAVKDENLQNSLREKGYKQIKKYSWQRCASRTLEVYKSIFI